VDRGRRDDGDRLQLIGLPVWSQQGRPHHDGPVSVDVEIQEMTPTEQSGVAAVARATGQSAEGLAGDPSYSGHVAARGRFLVARRLGRCVGFGGTVPVSGGSMLTDLFVDPGEQGTGVGSTLLEALWSTSPSRLTFASQRPPAIGLYARWQLLARWPLLYLVGDPGRLPDPGLVVERVDAATAARTERAWTGEDRAGDYAYWSQRPDGFAFVVRDGDDLVGSGAVGGQGEEFGLNHFRARWPEVSEPATAAALLAAGPGRSGCLLCLPGPNRAARLLLAHGFRIVDHDLHMSTDDVVLDPLTLVAHPGLV
jgi:GNAT superfamily N-acetyltransferase